MGWEKWRARLDRCPEPKNGLALRGRTMQGGSGSVNPRVRKPTDARSRRAAPTERARSRWDSVRTLRCVSGSSGFPDELVASVGGAFDLVLSLTLGEGVLRNRDGFFSGSWIPWFCAPILRAQPSSSRTSPAPTGIASSAPLPTPRAHKTASCGPREVNRSRLGSPATSFGAGSHNFEPLPAGHTEPPSRGAG